MGDFQVWCQGFGAGVDQLVEGALAPSDETLLRLLLFDSFQLLGIIACLGHSLGVFDFVLWRLGHDQALGIEAHPTRAPGYLVEFPGPEPAHPGPVELRQSCQQDRMDRYIDADSQGVRTADDRKQSLLGQLLNQSAVAGKHASIVDPHASAEKPLQYLAEGRREPCSGHGLLDPIALPSVRHP